VFPVQVWQVGAGLGVGAFLALIFFGIVKQFGTEPGKGIETSRLGREATAIIAVLIVLLGGAITIVGLVLYAPQRTSGQTGSSIYHSTPNGEYKERMLLPGVYKSSEFDPQDRMAKSAAILDFLARLGYEIADFGESPTKLVSPLVEKNDAGDLQLLPGTDGRKFYNLAVAGPLGSPQRVLLRTESQ
jgi:hypothetical protein